jgi:hypothetical protein
MLYIVQEIPESIRLAEEKAQIAAQAAAEKKRQVCTLKSVHGCRVQRQYRGVCMRVYQRYAEPMAGVNG